MNEPPGDAKIVSRAIGMLTNRQTEVLEWVAEGKSNQAIATILNISIKTVEFHLACVYEKVPVEDRRHLIAIVNRYHLLQNCLQ